MNPWLVVPRPRPRPRLRVLLLPHSGGGAVAFQRWHDWFPDDVESCAVQLPGRWTRRSEPAFTDITRLTTALRAGIERAIDGPFVIAGCSMGALLGYTLALELERSNVSPVALVAISAHAPQLPLPPPIAGEPDDAFVAAMAARFGAVDDVLVRDGPARRALLPVLRADVAVVESFRFSAPGKVLCPIVAFAGNDDRLVPDDALGAWRDVACSTFEAVRVAGGHFLPEATQRLIAEQIASRWCGT